MSTAKKHKKSPIDWQEYRRQILEKLNLESELESLGVEITGTAGEDGWAPCRAVDREDREPSAAVNLHTGHYIDLGGVGLSLSFFDLAAHVKKFGSWKLARDHYAAVAGLTLNGQAPRDPAENLVFMPWNPGTENLATLWANKKPGVTVEAVQAAGGRLARYRDQYTVITLPIFGPGLTAADPVGWVLYNTTGKELPIFHGKDKATGKMKISWKKMKTTGASESGIIGRHALDRLQRATKDEQFVLWKVEGPSDLLTLWATIPADRRDRHLVVTNAGGANETPKSWMSTIFAGRQVPVLGDADEPGQVGAAKWDSWIAKVAEDVRLVKLPYEVAKDHGKDLRDWIGEPHDYNDLLALIPDEAVSAGSETSETLDIIDSAIEQSDLVESDDDPHRLARVNLERYATRHDGRTVRFWRDEWYVWKRNAYRKISQQEFRAKITNSVRKQFEDISRAKMIAKESSDGEPAPVQKVCQALIGNVILATSGTVCLGSNIEPGTWLPDKSNRSYVSMANGILDIDEVMAGGDQYLTPNSPNWFSMTSLPYEFDPRSCCPRFNAFLSHNLEKDIERIAILQEWAGYLLLADTSQQKFLVLEGEGANGKSVFIAALTAMLGEENVSNIALENFADRFSRTETLGKLLNAAGDCGELDKAAEGFLKSFTSGDRMYFDRKGIAGLNCKASARLMVACNNRPRFSDHSEGLWRRMLLIPWRVKINNQERIFGMDNVKFWKDSGELPGILCWAIEGLARLKAQHGFSRSRIMDEAMKDYQEEMNPARVFLLEFVELERDHQIQCKDLYKFYRKWIEESGYRPMADKNFGREVRRRFPEMERKYAGTRNERFWIYQGLKFSQDEICGEKTEDAKLF